jgi:hypothetical protein
MIDETEKIKINEELTPLLVWYKKVFMRETIITFIMVVSFAISIYIIKFVINDEDILLFGILIIATIGIVFIIRSRKLDKLKMKLNEIISIEEKTMEQIINDNNHKLLPPGYKKWRSKIQFNNGHKIEKTIKD